MVALDSANFMHNNVLVVSRHLPLMSLHSWQGLPRRVGVKLDIVSNPDK
jgi:hypothetical protein